MKNIIKTTILIFLFVFIQESYSQEITSQDIFSHIKYLASEKLQGRRTGDKGAKLAAEYIRKQFIKAGLQPLADNFYQYYEVIRSVKIAKNNFFKFDGFKGILKKDFIPLSFSKNTRVNADVVFAGYGFDIQEDSLIWNDYQNINVKGKWVLILRGNPESNKDNSKFARYSSDRNKVITAKNKGAIGVFFVSGVKLEKKDNLIPFLSDRILSRSTIPAIDIKRKIADKILKTKKITIEDLETKLLTTKKPQSFDINFIVNAGTDVIREKVGTQNVVAVLKAKDSKFANEYIVIGAHYDHLGFGGPGSGSRMPDTIAIHPGADDNASGVAAVIELAKKFSYYRNKIKRSIIFVSFSGEEMGLLGSHYFITHPPVEKKQIKAMINIDMIGRLKKSNAILVGGTGTAKEFNSILDKYEKQSDIKFTKSPEGYGASDHASFYIENIPVLFFCTGAHEDYHTPFDKISKINSKGEKKLLDLIYKIIFNIDTRTKDLTFQEAGPKHRVRVGRYKVRLGIIPDYTSSDKFGLGVQGVHRGGPASIGGMKKGDRIIAINGQSVKDIYEYMRRLMKLKLGQTITVDVLRNGKKVVLMIQL